MYSYGEQTKENFINVLDRIAKIVEFSEEIKVSCDTSKDENKIYTQIMVTITSKNVKGVELR